VILVKRCSQAVVVGGGVDTGMVGGDGDRRGEELFVEGWFLECVGLLEGVGVLALRLGLEVGGW